MEEIRKIIMMTSDASDENPITGSLLFVLYAERHYRIFSGIVPGT